MSRRTGSSCGGIRCRPRRGAEGFEDDFAAYVSASHAVAVSSCTAALELALRALGLPAGAPVLVPAPTFCGAAQAILHAGLRVGCTYTS